jgi:hypothetical protein
VFDLIGAGERNRTLDLLITNELLYRLSYTGFQAQNFSMGFWACSQSLGFVVIGRHALNFILRTQHHADALMQLRRLQIHDSAQAVC